MSFGAIALDFHSKNLQFWKIIYYFAMLIIAETL